MRSVQRNALIIEWCKDVTGIATKSERHLVRMANLVSKQHQALKFWI